MPRHKLPKPKRIYTMRLKEETVFLLRRTKNIFVGKGKRFRDMDEFIHYLLELFYAYH